MARPRLMSHRSVVRAWTCYAALGYTALTVTIVGLTLPDLAERVGSGDPLALRVVFLGRGAGAVAGTILGGWLCDHGDKLPLKITMSLCVVASSLAVAAAPLLAAHAGVEALVADFVALGLSGSALVCCTVSAACWAFPGEQAAPVLQGCQCAFGISSAVLPVVLLPLRWNGVAEYGAVALGAVPALLLLCLSSSPEKPEGGKRGSARAAGVSAAFCWFVAVQLSLAQFLLQGTNSSLIAYLVLFGTENASMSDGDARLLVAVLQGSSTAGSLLAMRYQAKFRLLDLACLQLAIAVIGIAAWVALPCTAGVTLAGVGFIGFVVGPTLSYCSALFNQYTTPSGNQLAVINLGSNLGATIAPFLVGALLDRYGTSALPWSVLSAIGTVLLGMASAKAVSARSQRGARDDAEDVLLGRASQ